MYCKLSRDPDIRGLTLVRDIATISSLLPKIEKLKREEHDSGYDFLREKNFQARCLKVLNKRFGLKLREKHNALFIPKRSIQEYDGYIQKERFGNKLVLMIPTIHNDIPHIYGVYIQSLMSDRGLVHYVNKKDMLVTRDKNTLMVFIKDHAMRRMIERSPIKDHDTALGAICWFLLKNMEMTSTEVVSSEGGIPFVAGSFKSDVYGSVVGSALFNKTSKYSAFLVNTYLSEDMSL